jgi:hypothetical protein
MKGTLLICKSCGHNIHVERKGNREIQCKCGHRYWVFYEAPIGNGTDAFYTSITEGLL